MGYLVYIIPLNELIIFLRARHLKLKSKDNILRLLALAIAPSLRQLARKITSCLSEFCHGGKDRIEMRKKISRKQSHNVFQIQYCQVARTRASALKSQDYYKLTSSVIRKKSTQSLWECLFFSPLTYNNACHLKYAKIFELRK